MSKYRTLNRISRSLRNVKRQFIPSAEGGRLSFSENGEDLIIDNIFTHLSISKLSYLDLGANHPTFSSNTFFFYRKGHSGVLVEPDPILYAQLRKTRKRDVCLNIGVGISKEDAADFYVMTPRTLSTFSKQLVEEYSRSDRHMPNIEKIIQIPLLPVNEIIKNNFRSSPNLVSLDIEGMDQDVLRTFDLSYYRPQVFCVESQSGNRQVNSFMESQGYSLYAHTWVNAIFVAAECMSRL